MDTVLFMLKAIIQEAAALASLSLFIAMIAIWTQVPDVGICDERRQTVCTEPFRLGNAARRRGALRVRNAAFLIGGR